MASLEGDNLVVIYYLSAYENWSDKRCGVWWEEPYQRRTTILDISDFIT
jgi:hypothetical protein